MVRPYFCGPLDALLDLLVPDAVLRLGAASVHLLAMAVTETRIDTQRDGLPSHSLAVLFDHVRRTAIDMNVVFGDVIQRFPIENIRRIDDFGWMDLLAWLEPGRPCPVDFACTHAIHQRTVAPHQVHDGEVGTCFLGIANHIERGEVGDSLGDFRRIVDVRRRAEAAGQVRHRMTGNISESRGKGRGGGHERHWSL